MGGWKEERWPRYSYAHHRGKIAGSDLFTALPAAPCPTPGSKHKGQTHSQSNLLYFHLPGREGGEIKKKKKSHYLYLSFPSGAAKNANWGDSCCELFIFHSEDSVSFCCIQELLIWKNIPFQTEGVAEFRGYWWGICIKPEELGGHGLWRSLCGKGVVVLTSCCMTRAQAPCLSELESPVQWNRMASIMSSGEWTEETRVSWLRKSSVQPPSTVQRMRNS